MNDEVPATNVSADNKPGLGPQHGLIWVLLGLAVFCMIGAAAMRKYARYAEGLEVLGKVGAFQFTDQHGRTLTARDLRGRVWVASFIFTRCQGTCIAITDSLASLNKMLADQPDIRFVSFSMDPTHDTPEVLSAYAQRRELESARWQFLTGPKKEMYDLSARQFMLGVDENGLNADEPIIHSEKLVLVDRLGRIRAYYGGTDPAGVKALAADARRLNNAFGVYSLPPVNASLNALAGILTIIGIIFVKLRWLKAHRNFMVAAGIASGLFLACYLVYHAEAGSMPFAGTGTARTVYFGILISHVILAAVVAVLAPITFWHALSGNWEKHRRIAKITLPLWLYVSATGVVVYLMLYQFYAPVLP